MLSRPAKGTDRSCVRRRMAATRDRASLVHLSCRHVTIVLLATVAVSTVTAAEPGSRRSDSGSTPQSVLRIIPPAAHVRSGPGRLPVSGPVSILLPAEADVVTDYAAESLSGELARLYDVQTATFRHPQRPSTGGVSVIVKHLPSSPSAALPDEFGGVPEPGADGYLLRISPNEHRVVVCGYGGNGVIRGVFALTGLLSGDGNGAAWPEVLISDTPDMLIRFTRDIFANERSSGRMTRKQAHTCELDWWARWGLNHALIPSGLTKETEQQEQSVRWFIEEAHRRGMKAGANLGGRALCPSDPAEMEQYLSRARRLLDLGCDFLLVLFDDLPSNRLGGHCDRCIGAFGASLAREHRHILDSLCDLFPQPESDLPLFWCPTYYSLGMTGYIGAAEGPDEYFAILAQSSRVRRAFMFHCAFDREFNAYLERKGLRNRIWWYNGIRTDYYMVKREFDRYDMWGPPLRIPGLKDFQSFFSAFENGWLMPSFASANRSLHPCVAPLVTAGRDERGRTIVPKASLDELAHLGERMQGLYLCGATAPYHIAMAGIFAAHPPLFDQEPARKAVADAIFSRGSSPHALAWQTAYAAAQMLLARAQGRPLPKEDMTRILALTGEMETHERALLDCLARGKPALPPPVCAALLDDMTTWRLKVRSLAVVHPQAQPP